jgi:hypothetical protein
MSTPTISTSAPARKKVTTLTYRQKKERGEPITMLTAYDYPSHGTGSSRDRFHFGR